jgi:hypothetical protein
MPKMNVTPVTAITTNNEQPTTNCLKRTQTNPISSWQYSSIFMPVKSVVSGDYPENMEGFFIVKPCKSGCDYVQ